MKTALPKPKADKLPTPEVGRWSEDKYILLWLYATLFSSGMKNKWDKRVYIDLYSGAGQAKIRGTEKLVFGSPLLALQVKDPFDKYIFCEENPEFLKALEARARALAPAADISYVKGNCNERVRDILAVIPPAKGQTVLSLCFADPFDLGLQFKTLESLGARFTDFLMLLALYMDANRNYENYVREKSRKVEHFLDDSAWRQRWERAQAAGLTFPTFLAEAFASRMESLGYLPPPRMKMVRSDEKNLPLYHLALFSKSMRAHEFWGEVLKYSTDQIALF